MTINKSKTLIVLGVAIVVILIGLMSGIIPKRWLVGCGVPASAVSNDPNRFETNVFNGRIIEHVGTSSEKYAGALYKVEVSTNEIGGLEGVVIYDQHRSGVEPGVDPLAEVGKKYKFISRYNPDKCWFEGTRPIEIKEQ